MIELKSRPFLLDEEGEAWVKKTLASMTDEEKLGQLLCPSLAAFTPATSALIDTYHVGAVMIRPFEREGLREHLAELQKNSRIPLLIAANLENGGVGAVREGTLFANPMGCAATGETENGYRLGKISCSEAGCEGVNWAFAPIVDIDQNYHNPITNVRTFGSDPETVLSFARAYIRAAGEEGVLPTVKHFPGDGVDERDQHLLVSVNSLFRGEWEQSFGRIYRTLIGDGVPSVMAAHISAPEVARSLGASEEDAALPASQSPVLIQKLLREEMGFNGLVVTDSTLMVGYMQTMPRRLALPRSIAAGVDMILFNRSIEEDARYLKEGYESGIITKERLDEAVLRILATKAARGLHRGEYIRAHALNEEQKRAWVRGCADRAVTLVKDPRNILPLSPKNYKRVYLNVIENTAKNNSPFAKEIKRRFEREGFRVTLRRRAYPFDPNAVTLESITPAVNRALSETMCNTDDFVKKYDLAVIVLNIKTASNATVVRVNWNVLFGMGNDLPWYAGEMPLIAVSFSNPYHLLDIPMAHAYINAYTDNDETLSSVFDKLMGRSHFEGVSPVDAFCGKYDTRL